MSYICDFNTSPAFKDMNKNDIPAHVAIIMDGNGRWARSRGKERMYGHIHGVETVRTVLVAARKIGIKYLTLYAFSTENWGRPQQEVSALMELICSSIEAETPELKRQGVCVKIIGDRSALSPKVVDHIRSIESSTEQCSDITLILAINYSSRSEITHAVRRIAQRVEQGTLNADGIDPQTISEALYTAQWPDPDLIIRTSGECRLSNFLLWQGAYSELYFTDVLWPDFTEEDLHKAVQVYRNRDRRYGLVTSK